MSCPSGPLQSDATNNSGLLIRHAIHIGWAQRQILVANGRGGNRRCFKPNAHSRHMLRMSSMSPSSESPLRRPAYFHCSVCTCIQVPHPSRASLGATGSPSCFAPTGHQADSGSLPAVSVSRTNYIASSPFLRPPVAHLYLYMLGSEVRGVRSPVA